MATSKTELLPLEGAISGIWRFFGFPAKDGQFVEKDKKKRNEVTCRLCFQVLKYASNTTNMRFHLQTHHHREYAAMESQERARLASSGSSTSGGSSRMQPTLVESFKAQTLLPHTSHRWKGITDSVCYFLAKDMMPYDTVNAAGFRHMLHEIEPRYVPPDRKSVATNYMPKLYEREKARVQQQIEGINRFAITTDIWTSRAHHSYIGTTVHYVDAAYNLQSHMLGTCEFSDSHTAVNIAEELQQILQDWKLPTDCLSAATTDNGRNIAMAMEILGWPHMPCFSHTLQLAVEDAMKLPEVSKALARCRRLVSHFNHSSKSTYLLRQKQADLHHKQLSLVQDVPTRWNSAYYMVERILAQQQPLCATLLELRKGDLMPSESEFSTMETFVAVMKSLVEITEAIGAQKWVTISAIRPLLHKLLNIEFQPASSDSSLKKSMKRVMHSNLEHRYTGPKLEALNKAAFLDPRFKLLKFLSEEERESTIAQIEEESVPVCCNTVSVPDEEPAPKRARGERKLFHLLQDVVTPSEQEELRPVEKTKAEVCKYLSEDPALDNPLQWWKDNSSKYPTLVQLAKQYLAIPATSVPSERAFSAAGHIANERRSCLLPDSITMLVFLAENLH